MPTPGGYIVDSATAGPGDSGGALVINFTNGALDMGDRDFIIGNIHSIDITSGSGLNARGPAKANYFSSSEFASLMNYLSGNQAGNVTNSEPTNLIVGTSGAGNYILELAGTRH